LRFRGDQRQWWQLDDAAWVRSDVVSNQGNCDTLSDSG
jgi:hypothetical protein